MGATHLLAFRSSRTHQHTNPYARVDPAQWGHNVEPRDDGEWGAAGDGWSGRENVPMGLISTRLGSPPLQHNPSK